MADQDFRRLYLEQKVVSLRQEIQMLQMRINQVHQLELPNAERELQDYVSSQKKALQDEKEKLAKKKESLETNKVDASIKEEDNIKSPDPVKS